MGQARLRAQGAVQGGVPLEDRIILNVPRQVMGFLRLMAKGTNGAATPTQVAEIVLIEALMDKAARLLAEEIPANREDLGLTSDGINEGQSEGTGSDDSPSGPELVRPSDS